MEFIKNKNIVVLDIETTGIKANADKIIELYMLKVYNNEVIEEYYSKFNPEMEIPLFISNLTGISMLIEVRKETKNKINDLMLKMGFRKTLSERDNEIWEK